MRIRSKLIFKNVVMKRKVTMLRCLVALAILAPVLAFSQNEGKNSPDHSALVKKCDSLWYYGIDLSHVRVSDVKKISKSREYSTVYPAAWVAFVEKELPPMGYVKPALDKGGFFYIPGEVQNNTQKVSPDFIIGVSYSFPIDTVIKSVKSYNLSRKSGVGLVIVVENFNKNTETATSWITFFDIKTREILWAVQASGNCKHLGYTAHWGSGIVDGFEDFIRNVY